MQESKSPSIDIPADAIEPEVVDTDREMIPAAVRDLLDKREFSKEEALAKFEYLSKVVAAIRPAAMKELRPSDFVIMGDGADDDGVYLQNVGAQRIQGLLGMRYPSGILPVMKRIDEGDGRFTIQYEGYVGSTTLQTVLYVVGGRSSSEKFFDRYDDDENRLPVPEITVIKAARSNFDDRAVSGLCGLRGFTVADLKHYGMDPKKCKSVKHQKGTKGGGSGSVVPFGDHKGESWSDLPKDDLKWFLEWAKKAVDDPDKAKWKKSNERVLASIKNEIRRRQEESTAAIQDTDKSKKEAEFAASEREEGEGNYDERN